jgi:TRAP-type C4-dicarboxylate transport system permease small subunit
MRLLGRIDAFFARLEKGAVVALLALMVLAAFSQIVLRNLLGTGFAAAEPLVRYLVLWVGFLGAALAVRQGRHITIEITGLIKPGAGGRLRAVLPHFTSTLVCALLTYAAVKFVQDEAQIGNRTFLDLPAWIPELILPLAFGLMTLRFLLAFLAAVSGRAAAPAERPS